MTSETGTTLAAPCSEPTTAGIASDARVGLVVDAANAVDA